MSDASGDPLFQLNAVLWMLQPLPPHPPSRSRAVLYDNGYRVRALGKSLTTAPETERLLATKLGLRGAPAPDVLATAPDPHPWPVFECKRSFFGVESSTSTQATKVIARTGDLSLVAGSAFEVARPGCVVYVTRHAEAAALQGTLDELAGRIEAAGITPAPTSTIGMRVETGRGLVARVVSGSFPGPGGSALADDVVVLDAAGSEEDARPLYFIPYDPSIEQADEERARCLKILLARGQSHAASAVGRGPAPGTAILEGQALLEGATLGLSRYWRDTAAREGAAHEILRFVRSALGAMRKSAAPSVVEGSRPKRIEILLKSEEHRQECAEAVMAHPLPGEPSLPEVMADELPFADR